MSLTKQEKKIMDEKIAKVREVVRNVSTNDIVLALHNFELDVERTIHAFCEGGSEGALGTWETGGAAKKKQKNKGKAQASVAPTPANPIANPTPSRPAAVTTRPAVTLSSAPVSSNGYANGHNTATNNVEAKTANNSKTSSNGKTSLKNGQNTGISEPAPILFQNIPSQVKTNVPKMHKINGSQAEADLFKCFQEIRKILDERERDLISQLKQCHQEGARFCYDSSKLISVISHLGEVVPNTADISILSHSAANMVNPLLNGQGVNHSTSHSTISLVSSVGETDSGLGQTSPVSQEKSVAQVDNKGIIMQSDALSADQLADLQRRIEDTLKSQGIDPAVLSEFSSQNVAPRKRVPNKTNGGGNRRDGDNKSDATARNNKGKAGGKQEQMKLSIFQ